MSQGYNYITDTHNMNDYELDLLASGKTASAKSEPCCGGCAEKGVAAGSSLPDLRELDAQLSEVTRMSASPEVELAFAGLDTELSFTDELGLLSLDEDGLPSLGDLLAVVERHPGLKITFSY
jgi:hypothetical protein